MDPVIDPRPLVGLLYDLMFAHMAVGTVELMVKNQCVDLPVPRRFGDADLAHRARRLADLLLDPNKTYCPAVHQVGAAVDAFVVDPSWRSLRDVVDAYRRCYGRAPEWITLAADQVAGIWGPGNMPDRFEGVPLVSGPSFHIYGGTHPPEALDAC